VIQAAAARVSMDGRNRWMDNVFMGRLWRSPKYECVYLLAFETGSELSRSPHMTSKEATGARAVFARVESLGIPMAGAI
jgi:hypothetical protein